MHGCMRNALPLHILEHTESEPGPAHVRPYPCPSPPLAHAHTHMDACACTCGRAVHARSLVCLSHAPYAIRAALRRSASDTLTGAAAAVPAHRQARGISPPGVQAVPGAHNQGLAALAAVQKRSTSESQVRCLLRLWAHRPNQAHSVHALAVRGCASGWCARAHALLAAALGARPTPSVQLVSRRCAAFVRRPHAHCSTLAAKGRTALSAQAMLAPRVRPTLCWPPKGALCCVRAGHADCARAWKGQEHLAHQQGGKHAGLRGSGSIGAEQQQGQCALG